MSSRTRTTLKKSAVDPVEAEKLYNYLVENMPWVEGIKGRNGFTRWQTQYNFDNDSLNQLIVATILTFQLDPIDLEGVYLNWYKTGDDYTPSHSHLKSRQIIISLGATRTLKVNKKNYPLENGDIILFGTAAHGVPKEPEVEEGRISIALFLRKNSQRTGYYYDLLRGELPS